MARRSRLAATIGCPTVYAVSYTHLDVYKRQVIRQGAGRMPSFPNLSNTDVTALTQYVLSGESKELAPAGATDAPARYRFTGYRRFLDPDGYPAVQPPWGTLNAINLNTGEYAWKVPLGEYPALVAQGVKDTGSENYGGRCV